jgi:hypothetical protein
MYSQVKSKDIASSSISMMRNDSPPQLVDARPHYRGENGCRRVSRWVSGRRG